MCPPSLSDTYCNAVADGFLDPFGKFIDPVGGPGDNNIFVDFQLGVRVEVLEAVFPFNCHNRYLESIFDALFSYGLFSEGVRDGNVGYGLAWRNLGVVALGAGHM